jgi:hypothetical protein
MKNLIFFLALCSSYFATAQNYLVPDKAGQFWNTSNGYYGTINANTIDAGNSLDTANNTTIYLYQSDWDRTGRYAFDSARVLQKNTSGSGPYYLPYSRGLNGPGTLSMTAILLKASITSTVTPSVVITPEQSPNGSTGWVAIPGVTAATVTPSSRSVTSSTTFNIADTYQKYLRAKIVSTDTASVKVFYNFKPKSH